MLSCYGCFNQLTANFFQGNIVDRPNDHPGGRCTLVHYFIIHLLLTGAAAIYHPEEYSDAILSSRLSKIIASASGPVKVINFGHD